MDIGIGTSLGEAGRKTAAQRPTGDSSALIETGDALLLETGDILLLEN